MNSILEAGPSGSLIVANRKLEMHPNTMIIATASCYNLKQCKNFTPSLLSRFLSLKHLETVQTEELIRTLKKEYPKSSANILAGIGHVDLKQK